MHYLVEGFSNMYENSKHMSKDSTIQLHFKQGVNGIALEAQIKPQINVLESCNILIFLTIRQEGSSYVYHIFPLGFL